MRWWADARLPLKNKATKTLEPAAPACISVSKSPPFNQSRDRIPQSSVLHLRPATIPIVQIERIPPPAPADLRGKAGPTCREIFETVQSPRTCSGGRFQRGDLPCMHRIRISNLRRTERIARWLKRCDLGGALARLRCSHVDRFFALDRAPCIDDPIRTVGGLVYIPTADYKKKIKITWHEQFESNRIEPNHRTDIKIRERISRVEPRSRKILRRKCVTFGPCD